MIYHLDPSSRGTQPSEAKTKQDKIDCGDISI